MFFFIRFVSLRLYSIVWMCVCHKKVTQLDTFLNKLCFSYFFSDIELIEYQGFLVLIGLCYDKQIYWSPRFCRAIERCLGFLTKYKIGNPGQNIQYIEYIRFPLKNILSTILAIIITNRIITIIMIPNTDTIFSLESWVL